MDDTHDAMLDIVALPLLAKFPGPKIQVEKSRRSSGWPVGYGTVTGDGADTFVFRPHGSYLGMSSGRGPTKIQSIKKALVKAFSSARFEPSPPAFINSLPPEVLGYIFTFIPSPAWDRSSAVVWNCYRVDTFEVKIMTHVCRYWRNVAFSTPSLWTSIRHDSPPIPGRLGQFPLHGRSRGALLSLSLRHLGNSAIYGILRTEASRIRELSIIDNEYPPDDIPNMLVFPAPSLEHLMIDGSGRKDAVTRSQESALIFQGDAPRLTMLSLMAIPWIPSNSFANLTHLCLSGEEATEDTRPAMHSMSALFALLSHAPRLQELFLVHVMWIISPVTIVDIPSVPLSHLRRLILDQMPSRCVVTFLSRVHLPLTIAMSITSLQVPPGTRFSALEFFGLARLQLTDGMTRLYLKQDGNMCCSVVLASATGALRFCMQYRDKLEWVPVLCEMLLLSGIEELWLETEKNTQHFPSSPPSKVLGMLLAAMPALKLLVLSIIPVPELMECLELLCAAPLPAPALATLLINSVDFPESIAPLLAHRREHGRPIARVVIYYYGHRYKIPPWFQRLQQAASDGSLEAHKCKDYMDEPVMAVPAVCTQHKPFEHWPEWTSTFSLQRMCIWLRRR